LRRNGLRKEGYPFDDTNNLARVARFLSLKYDAGIHKAKAGGAHVPPLHRLTIRIRIILIVILAELGLPVYITTGYDDFMFQALKHAEKDVIARTLSVETGISGWSYGLHRWFYAFSRRTPVVFNFHGVTEDLDSLVLTEDDYFEFLIECLERREVNPASNRKKRSDGSSLPAARVTGSAIGISASCSTCSRVTWRITTSRTHVAVQIAPIPDEAPEDQRNRVQGYMDMYFEKYKKLDIRIYWGTLSRIFTEASRSAERKWKPLMHPTLAHARSSKAIGRSSLAELRKPSKLVSLITAHPVVLLYAQSGGGKTSIVKERGLIPLLVDEEEKFHVLPPMRVRENVGRLQARGRQEYLYVQCALEHFASRSG
jgi:hypothetical protein